MREISLHIMDIAQNSVRAQASLIVIRLLADSSRDRLRVEITDNGTGMSEEMVAHVTDPFVTSRTTRRVGLGLSLLQAGAEGTGGTFSVTSELGKGTTVDAQYVMSHLDRPPIGDFAGTAESLMVCNPELDFLIEVKLPDQEEPAALDTREIRDLLGADVRLDEPEIASWIRENLHEMFPAAYTDY